MKEGSVKRDASHGQQNTKRIRRTCPECPIVNTEIGAGRSKFQGISPVRIGGAHRNT
jgi:hypothetical protein